jgi:division protein 1
MDFNALGRAPLRLGMQRQMTSEDLEILESTPDLLLTPIPEAEGIAKEVSLLKGFNATIPSSEKSKARRRKTRNLRLDDGGEDNGELGLKRLGLQARGMLTEDAHNHSGDEGHGTTHKKRRSSRRGGEPMNTSKFLGKEELARQRREILEDKENLHVRRVRLPILRLIFQHSLN